MKEVAILCFAVFISSYSMEVTDEDINSPLVNYVPSCKSATTETKDDSKPKYQEQQGDHRQAY